ncbi:Rhodanese-like protein, partial [Ramicandelaber brevisporus]
IDVREPHEYAQGHIPTAHNVPLSEFQQAVELSDSAFAAKYGFEKAKLQPTSGKDEQVVFYCRGGVRSLKCIGIAAQHGVTGVRNYKGSWGDYAPR